MPRSVALLALGGAALLAFGLWMGRSASEPAKLDDAAQSSRATPAVATAVPTPTPARARVPAQPALRRTTPAAPTLPGLAADLISADPKVRRAAVAEVASSADADPQILLTSSRDPDPSIAATSIVALGKLYADGRVATSDMLAVAADRTHGPRIRTMALNAVGTVPNPDTARMLVELLASGDVGQRRAASALLGSQDAADAIPALIRALSDSDEYVRDNAVTGLRARSRGRDFGTDAGAWQSWWQAQRR